MIKAIAMIKQDAIVEVTSRAAKGDFTVSAESGIGKGQFVDAWYLFLTSYAACTLGYITYYCEENDICPEGIRSELTYDSFPIEDDIQVTDFYTTIFFPTEFPSEHKEGAKEAAANCRVGKHIGNSEIKRHYKIEEMNR